jgi:hypothetical protein
MPLGGTVGRPRGDLLWGCGVVLLLIPAFIVRLGHVQMQRRSALGGAQWRVSYLQVLVKACTCIWLPFVFRVACSIYVLGILSTGLLLGRQAAARGARVLAAGRPCAVLLLQPLQ